MELFQKSSFLDSTSAFSSLSYPQQTHNAKVQFHRSNQSPDNILRLEEIKITFVSQLQNQNPSAKSSKSDAHQFRLRNFSMFKRLSRLFTMNLEDFNIVKEGKATILAPKADKVFYNHIQQFNRDLSVMAINAWLTQYKNSKDGERELRKKRKLAQNQEAVAEPDFVRILEALSATGLRAIRYGHEIPQVSKIVANDLLAEAVQLINRSSEHNGLAHKVVGHQGDAIKYMGSLPDHEKFHCVDLDPYGTASPFLDSAVQLVKDDGLLLVTCTDAGVLAGSGYPEKCYSLYGGNNFGNTVMGLEANHEAGIRLILGSVAAAAARYKKCIEPVLSLSIDYYFRVFVRVNTSPIEVKKLASNTMLTYHCVGCGHTVEQRMGRSDPHSKKYQTPRVTPVSEYCPHCDNVYHLAGPMWAGKLHNSAFIDEVLRINSAASSEVYGTKDRIKGMLTLAKSELETPFYFNLNKLQSFLRAPPMSIDDFARAMGNMGHNVSLTHARKNCVKTDAPWEDVLQSSVAWLRRSNEKLVKEFEDKLEKETKDTTRAKLAEKIANLNKDLNTNTNLTEGMVGYKILQKLHRKEVDFDTINEVSDRISKLRRLKMVRYQENPTKNWGPKARPSEL